MQCLKGILGNGTEQKGWKLYVVQALGSLSGYKVGGFWIRSTIYRLDSFTQLEPSHINYSKVDPGLSDMDYVLQKARNYVHKMIFYH